MQPHVQGTFHPPKAVKLQGKGKEREEREGGIKGGDKSSFCGSQSGDDVMLRRLLLLHPRSPQIAANPNGSFTSFPLFLQGLNWDG